MATTTSVIIDTLDDIIEERLYPDVQDTLLEIEPIFDQVPVTSRGVRLPNDGISRDWCVRKVIATGIAGHLQWGNPYADTMRTGLTNVSTIGGGVGSPWPDPSDLPLKGAFTIVVPMAVGHGNIVMPLEVFRANELDAAIMDVIEANLKGAAHGFALQFAAALFQKTDGYLAKVDTVSAGGSGSDAYATFTISDGRIAAFEDGMTVDIIKSDGTVRNASDGTWAKREALLVDGVDPLNNTLTVRLADDGSTFGSQVAQGDLIYIGGSYDSSHKKAWRQPYGLDDWIVNSGTMFAQGQYANYSNVSGINVATYPKFKSLIQAVNGTITELELTNYIAAFRDAYGMPLDTIITTTGVTNKYYEQPLADVGRSVWDRTNNVLQFMSGRARIGFSFDGVDYTWFQSRLCPPQTLYIIRRRNNLVQLRPPAVPGSEGKPNFANAIEFIGKALGYNDAWIPVRDSNGRPLPMREAPCTVFRQVMPTHPQSIKLTGLTEA